jgi:hypothetical protein
MEVRFAMQDEQQFGMAAASLAMLLMTSLIAFKSHRG